jgi:hypothetical protein
MRATTQNIIAIWSIFTIYTKKERAATKTALSKGSKKMNFNEHYLLSAFLNKTLAFFNQ